MYFCTQLPISSTVLLFWTSWFTTSMRSGCLPHGWNHAAVSTFCSLIIYKFPYWFTSLNLVYLGFVHIWDLHVMTLRFFHSFSIIKSISYLDVSHEYPLWSAIPSNWDCNCLFSLFHVCKICYGSASLSYIPKFILMLGWIFPAYFQVCLVNALFWMISYNSLEKAHHLPWMEQNHIRILHRNALNGSIKFEKFDIIIILSISIS